MHPSVLLLLYAVLAGTLADRVLSRSPWARRVPSAALVLWHTTAASVLASLLAALYLFAHDISEHSLARLLHADKGLLHAVYAPPREGSELWNLAALGAAALLLALVLGALLRHRAARRTALDHRVAVTGTRVLAWRGGAVRLGVIDSSLPTVYCLAAGPREGRILVTRAALEHLPHRLLLAAIAHEEAHLRHRHHAQLHAAQAVSATTRRLGLLRSYADSVAVLVEMEADDVAAGKHGARTVAASLLELAHPLSAEVVPGRPVAGLAVGSVEARSRIQRLLQPAWSGHPRRWRWRPVATLAAVTLASLVPLVAALTPALALSGTAPDPRPGTPVPVPAGFTHHP